MKIINIKFSFKLFIIIILSVIILLSAIFLVKLYKNNSIKMNNQNYTKILKEVHDNIYTYVNKEIITNGYIFRASDFKENQFVVARDMIVSENDYRIVGFLCENSEIKNFENNTWIEVKGIIKLKNYHGPMPIIEVSEIKKITTPDNILVYPPK